MADNGKAIQLLAGSRRKLDVTLPGENRPIYIGIVFLVIMGLLFGAVSFYLANLKSQVANLDNELVTLENKRDKKFEKEALVWDKRLSLAGSLIKNHIVWSRAMQKIESLTPSMVQFSNYHSIFQDDMIEIKATAPSYTVIAKSIAALSADPNFIDTSLNKITSLPSGFLEYDIRVKFSRSKLLLNMTEEKKP